MIVVAQNGMLRVITQNDHAHLAAEMLTLWRADQLPANPRRRDLLLAAREHDNGWRETDAAPRFDAATGRPHDFISLPQAERRELWQRGTERFVDAEPYASLLILQHARNLHHSLSEQQGWRPLFARWQELEIQLLDRTGASRERLAGDYRWIELSDLFSLSLCRSRCSSLCGSRRGSRRGSRSESAAAEPGHRITEPLAGHGYRGHLLGNTLHLDPLPLAGATTFSVPSRLIADRPYRSNIDVAMELATARWGQTSLRLAPCDSE